MDDNLDRDQGHIGENWLTDWEDQCIQQWQENEPNMDEKLQSESERSAQKMWLSFQNSATAISKLYKDRCQNNLALWIPFQNSASGVTILYKDGLDAMKKTTDLGIQYGHQRRTKDILSWLRKKRRHIRREDLIAYLCGKNPPMRPRPTASLGRTASKVGMVGMGVERSSPRLTPATAVVEDRDEPDLQPFREAIALQRLNGAMSNISMGYSPSRGSNDVDSESCNGGDDDFHCFILDEISRRCDHRKRSSSSEVIKDSPSRKRSRLL